VTIREGGDGLHPTADVKLNFENKDIENNWVKHWVRKFMILKLLKMLLN